ncbi:MAG TPA: ATP-binding cassette domain-containing protein [Bacilli bacterium]
MITVRNLQKLAGESRTPILRNINLHLIKGEFVAIIGRGGSGKTTLLRCISGREKWNKGSITFEGVDLQSMNIWRKYLYRKACAYLAEQPILNKNKTAAKNVLSGRYRRSGLLKMATGLVSQDEHYTAYDYLSKVGLLDKADYKVEKLSGGERQRVAIGRALAWGAKVICADEPVSGLDPHSAAQVMDDFRRLCKEEELTVICCLNNIDLAEKYCSRIVGIADGEIKLDVSRRRLLQQEKKLILG